MDDKILWPAVQHLGFDLRFAKLMLLLINVTTEVIWQPWLQGQSVKRIAGTLNYFLKYLTGGAFRIE